MGKYNSGIHDILEGHLFRESPLISAAAKWGRLSRYFGIPALLLFLIGPASIRGSLSSITLYFLIATPLAVGAVMIRWWCLGYTRGQGFIVNGPYRYVRNPVELSCVLAYIAAAILLRFPWWYTVTIAFLCVLHMSFVSIAYERQLIERFGSQYVRYAQRVRRWIPSRLPATNSARPDFNMTRALISDRMILVWIALFFTVFGLRIHYGSIDY